MRAVDFLHGTSRFRANPTGNDARLKDINFLIESAKSCNDFSIGAIPHPAEDSRRSICEKTSLFLISYIGNLRNARRSFIRRCIELRKNVGCLNVKKSTIKRYVIV